MLSTFDKFEKLLLISSIIIGIIVALIVLPPIAHISYTNALEENMVSDSSINLNQVKGLANAYKGDSKTKYKNISFTKEQCLYIFSKAIIMKNNGETGLIYFSSYDKPSNPLDSTITNSLTKNQYIDMAERTSQWFENYKYGPNYTGINSPGNPDVGYDYLIRAFSNVLKSDSLINNVNF